MAKTNIETATVKTAFTIYSSSVMPITATFDEDGNLDIEQDGSVIVIPVQAVERFKSAVYKLDEVRV